MAVTIFFFCNEMDLLNDHFRSYVFIKWNRGVTGIESFKQLSEQPLNCSPSRATVFRWCIEFGKGRQSASDLPRSGRNIVIKHQKQNFDD